LRANLIPAADDVSREFVCREMFAGIPSQPTPVQEDQGREFYLYVNQVGSGY
jgi:hypothetical protein